MRACAHNNIARQSLQLVARQSITKTEIRREKRQAELNFSFGGKLNLGALGRFAHSRQEHWVIPHNRATCLCDLSREKFCYPGIQIVATQARVAMRGEHLEDALLQFQYRKIECAAT